MEFELEIIDSLDALQYDGSCIKKDVLTKALETGPRSPQFREVVSWLAHELHVLRKTDEKVDKEVTDPNEFAMELSAMLKELGCPYEKFVTGPLSDRFQSKESCAEVLEYLITELMSIKMCLKLKPAENTFIISKFETDTAKALEMLTKDLGLGKPPENVTTKAFFDKINFKVEELLRKINPKILGEPLLKTTTPLTNDQWEKLEKIHANLDTEYNLRRQMLLTRLEVTIQSFQWSDNVKKNEDEIIGRFQKKLKELEHLKYGGKETNLVALLAARSDLAIIEKTSSANMRKNTSSKLHKHIIGSVPDRGGRANEHAPPPPEMPSWQQQRAGPSGGGGAGRGNFRGGRGGGGAGRGGGGAGGRGGGHNWQQGNHPARQQQYEQRPQFDQSQNQNWIAGSGRVQGSGWTQRGNNWNGGNGGGENSQPQRGGNWDRGQGSGNYRGRSNYNRGGGQRR